MVEVDGSVVNLGLRKLWFETRKAAWCSVRLGKDRWIRSCRLDSRSEVYRWPPARASILREFGELLPEKNN